MLYLLCILTVKKLFLKALMVKLVLAIPVNCHISRAILAKKITSHARPNLNKKSRFLFITNSTKICKDKCINFLWFYKRNILTWKFVNLLGFQRLCLKLFFGNCFFLYPLRSPRVWYPRFSNFENPSLKFGGSRISNFGVRASQIWEFKPVKFLGKRLRNLGAQDYNLTGQSPS